MEAHYTISTGKKAILSEQQLVDCAQAYDNHGCDGGLPSQAFQYIASTSGIETEGDYPYTAVDGKCVYDASKAAVVVKAGVNITEGDETMLVDAIFKAGPVSVAFDCEDDFMLYKSGVYDSTQPVSALMPLFERICCCARTQANCSNSRTARSLSPVLLRGSRRA